MSVRRAYARREPLVLGVAGLLLALAAWEAAARLGLLNPVIVSSPSLVAAAFARQWSSGDLAADAGTSLTELAVGFSLSAVVGVALGLAMGLSRRSEYALDPFVWFLYAAPVVAFYPVIIVISGFGFGTVIVITVLLSVVPIAINALAGVRSVDPVLVRAVRAFGGGRAAVIRTVILPASRPLVLAGLRIGLGRALIGVVLGEMFGANAGLGFRLTYYGARLATSDVFVPLVIVVLFGVAATQALRVLEH